MEKIKMDSCCKERTELKINKRLEEYQGSIKNIEKAAVKAGITVEEGIKFLYYLCTED